MSAENKYALDVIVQYFNTKWHNIDPETYFTLGFEIFGIKDFRFSRILAGYGPPPYESSFKYRISKFYLVALGRFYFGPVSRYVRNAIMK